MIDSFKGPYRWLSNFEMCTIEFNAITYPSSEHAYMAQKTTSSMLRKQIAAALTPGAAKKLGRGVELRPNWDKIKLGFRHGINHNCSRECERKSYLERLGSKPIKHGTSVAYAHLKCRCEECKEYKRNSRKRNN